MDWTYHYHSPLGGMTLASNGTALTGLWFDGQRYYAETLSAGHVQRNLPVFDETSRWLDLYFSGRIPDAVPPLAPRGTVFRRSVWNILLTVPYGRTITYGEIAERIGGTSARAVGNAVAHNPVSLIIPCHRVIGVGGRLTGYAGGIDRKEYLLRMEQEK